MSWIVAGVAGAGVLSSLANNAEQRNNQKQQMLANAAQIQYSPWTHASAQTMGSNAPSAVGAALQGGTAGAMIGSSVASHFGQPTPAPQAPGQPQVPTLYGNSNGNKISPY